MMSLVVVVAMGYLVVLLLVVVAAEGALEEVTVTRDTLAIKQGEPLSAVSVLCA